ncbi:MAG: Rieske (2Fe-2S) protein [Gemmatimonadota bacterium]
MGIDLRNGAGTDRFVRVCRVSEIAPGEGRHVRAGEQDVALFNVGGCFYAVHNLCPHAGGPLAEGTLDGRHVICSWHYATFDLETGESLDSISRHDVKTLPVRVDGEHVWIGVGDPMEETPS